MYNPTSFSLLTATTIISLISQSFAIPFDNSFLDPIKDRSSNLEDRAAGAFCSYPSTYTFAKTTVVYAAPELVTGDFVGPGPTGASITSGYTYIKTMQFTGGITGSFDITKALTLGAVGQVAVAIGKSATLSATVNCPPNVVCGLVARGEVMRVTGYQTMHLCGSNKPYDTSFPCTLSAPSWCPSAVWNITTEKPFNFIAEFPIKIPRSTVGGQDQSPTDFLACTVGKGTNGLNPCPLTIGPAPIT